MFIPGGDEGSNTPLVVVGFVFAGALEGNCNPRQHNLKTEAKHMRYLLNYSH